MTNLLKQVLLLNLYLQPTYFILSITLNMLSICVLRSRALRSSPCTYYLIANAIFNMIYTIQVCPIQILRFFDFDLKNSPIGCKIISYLPYLSGKIARTMLVLAAFDRYCASSLCTRLQLKSKIRASKFTIAASTILLTIALSPALIFYNWKEHTQTCQIDSNLIIHIYAFAQILFHYIVEPILMVIFGILTVYNIHQHGSHIRSPRAEMRGRRTEGQLARMLLLQISVHLILSIPYGIIYIWNTFFVLNSTPDMRALRHILALWQQSDYFVPFFLYVFSGSVYREELFKIIRNVKCNNTEAF